MKVASLRSCVRDVKTIGGREVIHVIGNVCHAKRNRRRLILTTISMTMGRSLEGYAVNIRYHAPTNLWICQRERRYYARTTKLAPKRITLNGLSLVKADSRCGSCGDITPPDTDPQKFLYYSPELRMVIYQREFFNFEPQRRTVCQP